MLIILFRPKSLRSILKILSLNLMTELELRTIRIFLLKFTLKIGPEKYLLYTLFGKLIFGLKHLNRETFKTFKNI